MCPIVVPDSTWLNLLLSGRLIYMYEVRCDCILHPLTDVGVAAMIIKRKVITCHFMWPIQGECIGE